MTLLKKQSGFALPLVILIVVVLVTVGTVGYYSYKTSQELEEIGKGLEVVKPKPTIDETADWNIYNNYIF
ncbi:unnamed protein product [marine sediment metagenome]|uniref:Uncharacterized protein n=1 Tax=marine sediment metagenome TaxID=412755 RepID=X1L9V2_9ZZZZ